MLCPECNHTLNPISINTVLRPVTLDYCTNCGGIWSDQGETNFLKNTELGPLLNILPKKPQHPITQSQICPRDRTPLQPYSGESIPHDLVIYRCSRCSGVWFPEGSLADFKRAQQAKIDYFKLWKIPLHSIYAIMLPLLLIVVLGGGLIATLVGMQTPQDSRTRAKETISKPLVIARSTQALISFTSSQAATAKIKYWRQEQTVNEVWVSDTLETTHTTTLKNLEPGVHYSYQIILKEPKEISSEVYTFTTAKE